MTVTRLQVFVLAGTVALTASTITVGCTARSDPAASDPAASHPAASHARGASATHSVLRLATTTSTRDAGLLDQLVPVFEEQCDCRVDVIAVGTGAALKLGKTGDVDVLLVHARQAEEAFMRAGHGVRHEEFMVNHFTILGPEDDPAAIRGRDAFEALKRIAQSQQSFLSRGDDSGTHKREITLWAKAGGRPDWNGYLQSGQGMGPTLIMADEMQGYVLTDQGTYFKLRTKLQLVPLVDAADPLRNPYAAIVVNPVKHEMINSRLAEQWVDFLISPETQQLIRDCQVSGQTLFHPTRLTDGD